MDAVGFVGLVKGYFHSGGLFSRKAAIPSICSPAKKPGCSLGLAAPGKLPQITGCTIAVAENARLVQPRRWFKNGMKFIL